MDSKWTKVGDPEMQIYTLVLLSAFRGSSLRTSGVPGYICSMASRPRYSRAYLGIYCAFPPLSKLSQSALFLTEWYKLSHSDSGFSSWKSYLPWPLYPLSAQQRSYPYKKTRSSMYRTLSIDRVWGNISANRELPKGVTIIKTGPMLVKRPLDIWIILWVEVNVKRTNNSFLSAHHIYR